jgi:hypothetical protein
MLSTKGYICQKTNFLAMKKIIHLPLLLAAAALVYFIVTGIQRPIEFEKEMKARHTRVVNDLKDIRELQVAFRARYQKYTGDMDSLIEFAKKDSLLIITKVGDIEDTIAVALGEVRWDSVYVPVIPKLKSDNKLSPTFIADSLKYIPFSFGEKYKMGIGRVTTASKVEVDVFEASALNRQILKGMNNQLRINEDERQEARTGFRGLRVGSLTEANNNAGNWE